MAPNQMGDVCVEESHNSSFAIEAFENVSTKKKRENALIFFDWGMYSINLFPPPTGICI
jgi:hypothetical protein